MNDTELFDTKNFMLSLANDPDLARELLQAFLDDSPERTATLRQQIAEGDTATASRTAHSLKGMCGVVRAPRLMELALDMEVAGKEGAAETLADRFREFEPALSQAHGLMRAFIDTL